ncbi:unnamed protein product [Protopolystoma xenopodis]|uniref:Fibronectin type-III domain-containing protein n=1 Tax=Protopolystoma xenopodis TaxID=117903 RepID=A0A448XAD1_9PLAT|nr:unnamed protein product [Protopolystoma xenopodis]
MVTFTDLTPFSMYQTTVAAIASTGEFGESSLQGPYTPDMVSFKTFPGVPSPDGGAQEAGPDEIQMQSTSARMGITFEK